MIRPSEKRPASAAPAPRGANAATLENNADSAKIGQQRLSNAREKIISDLTALVTERHKDSELDYLINTTQALVTSNNEIWDRCKANLDQVQNKQFNHLSENLQLTFQCVDFYGVSVTRTMTQKFLLNTNLTYYVPGLLTFQACSTQQRKAFSVPCFPHPLRTVVIPSLDKDGMLNYLEYLQRSFFLEESILLPFLAILKDHLEEFQVFLGEVESWLMGCTRIATFLQETFNVKLEVAQRAGQQLNLKTINLPNDQSVYNISFDVSSSHGQERLTKFLSFTTH